MSALHYTIPWATAAQFARAGLRLGIILTEGALLMLRSAERSLDDQEHRDAEPDAPGTRPEAMAEAGAVPRDQTVHDDYVVCLEDGKRFKTLKGHLRAAHDLSPKQYRAKWGLPADHPLVAPVYSAKRAAVAKKIGLGAKRRPGSPRRSPKSARPAA